MKNDRNSNYGAVSLKSKIESELVNYHLKMLDIDYRTRIDVFGRKDEIELTRENTLRRIMSFIEQDKAGGPDAGGGPGPAG